GWQAPSFSICIFPILPGPLRVSAVFWHLSTGPFVYINKNLQNAAGEAHGVSRGRQVERK
ncbi:MAG: hypothetical protein KH431_10725, partial [Erysipelotrichaceae bacterium]|nr:hypothetical protein [Erysipelotrichaceae bacterium]